MNNRLFQRLVSILLVILLAIGQPLSVLAEEVDATAQAADAEITATDDLADEPAAEPTNEQPTEPPVAEQTDEPSEEIVDQATDTSIDEPTPAQTEIPSDTSDDVTQAPSETAQVQVTDNGIESTLDAQASPTETVSSTQTPSPQATQTESTPVLPPVYEPLILRWNETGDALWVTGMGDVAVTTLTIPSSVEDWPVEGISDEAFAQNTVLETVVVKQGITTVGKRAFAESALKTLSLPDSVREIGQSAFYQCSDLTIVAPAESYAAQFALDTGVPVINEMPDPENLAVFEATVKPISAVSQENETMDLEPLQEGLNATFTSKYDVVLISMPEASFNSQYLDFNIGTLYAPDCNDVNIASDAMDAPLLYARLDGTESGNYIISILDVPYEVEGVFTYNAYVTSGESTIMCPFTVNYAMPENTALYTLPFSLPITAYLNESLTLDTGENYKTINVYCSNSDALTLKIEGSGVTLEPKETGLYYIVYSYQVNNFTASQSIQVNIVERDAACYLRTGSRETAIDKVVYSGFGLTDQFFSSVTLVNYSHDMGDVVWSVEKTDDSNVRLQVTVNGEGRANVGFIGEAGAFEGYIHATLAGETFSCPIHISAVPWNDEWATSYRALQRFYTAKPGDTVTFSKPVPVNGTMIENAEISYSCPGATIQEDEQGNLQITVPNEGDYYLNYSIESLGFYWGVSALIAVSQDGESESPALDFILPTYPNYGSTFMAKPYFVYAQNLWYYNGDVSWSLEKTQGDSVELALDTTGLDENSCRLTGVTLGPSGATSYMLSLLLDGVVAVQKEFTLTLDNSQEYVQGCAFSASSYMFRQGETITIPRPQYTPQGAIALPETVNLQNMQIFSIETGRYTTLLPDDNGNYTVDSLAPGYYNLYYKEVYNFISFSCGANLTVIPYDQVQTDEAQLTLLDLNANPTDTLSFSAYMPSGQRVQIGTLVMSTGGEIRTEQDRVFSVTASSEDLNVRLSVGKATWLSDRKASRPLYAFIQGVIESDTFHFSVDATLNDLGKVEQFTLQRTTPIR